MAGKNKTSRLRQVGSRDYAGVAVLLLVPVLIAIAIFAAPLLLVIAGVLLVGLAVMLALMTAMAVGERKVMRYE